MPRHRRGPPVGGRRCEGYCRARAASPFGGGPGGPTVHQGGTWAMYRRLAGCALCLFVLLAAACSNDEPITASPQLPAGTALTHVDVTKVATPSSVDPQQLPANARRAS